MSEHTQQEFIEKWKTHNKELTRLKSNLPREEWPTVEQKIEEINEIVKQASENLDKDLKEMEE